MRVVVDTNVFVSAVLKANPFFPRRSLDRLAWRLNQIGPDRAGVARHSGAATHFGRHHPLPPDDLAKMLARAELIAITERIAACRDPKDDKFLELAVNGHADLIISGDADLLTLNPFREIPIVKPAAFVQGAPR